MCLIFAQAMAVPKNFDNEIFTINRACFFKLTSTCRFLARQRLAVRGDGTSEPDSNFLQVVKLRAEEEVDDK